MDIELFREHCLSLPQVTEDFPFDETLLAFRVKNHIFACIGLDHPQLATMKCDPEYAMELRDHYQAVEPAFHWNKKYWNQVWFDRDADDNMICGLVNHSYREVLKKLPKRERAELEQAAQEFISDPMK